MSTWKRAPRLADTATAAETPAAAGFRLPPAWARHTRCWMGWPHAPTWGAGVDAARVAFARVANAIAEFEPVSVLCRRADRRGARRCLAGEIELVDAPLDDAWLRDSGPVFVRDVQGRVGGVAWNFNGWGDKFRPWDNDRRLAPWLLEQLELPCWRAPLVAEGGAFDGDGSGRLLTTEQCLLNPNRNPGADRARVERALCQYTGVDRVIWLPRGLEGDHTDGHVDELAVFAAADVVVFNHCDDPGDANYAVARVARERLQEAAGACGRGLRPVALPQPRRRTNSDGERLPLSYVNYYRANSGVVMPAFGQKRYDRGARDRIAELHPGCRVIQCPALDIVAGGGGIHCITQPQPEALSNDT